MTGVMFFTNVLSFLLLLSIPVIIFLSFTGKKRYTLHTTTLYLWNTTLVTKKNSLKMRRFIKNLCLIFRILIIMCIAAALAEPYIKSGIHVLKKNVILILDVSASMNVPYSNDTRFHEAKRKAYECISLPGKNNTMAVIEAGAIPRLITPFTDNRATLKKIIMQSRTTDEPGHIHDALDLAFSLTRGKPDYEVILISDGAFSLSQSYNNKKIRYIKTGDNRKNIGITEFYIRRKEGKGGSFEILIKVQSFCNSPEQTNLAVYSGQEAGYAASGSAKTRATTGLVKIYEENFLLESFSEKTFIIHYSGRGEDIIKAEIDSKDDLLADNNAWAVLKPREQVEVLLVTKGNFFLESVFRSFPNITLTRADELNYSNLLSASKKYDIIIFDRINTPHLVKGKYILIRSFPQNLPIKVQGNIVSPPVLTWEQGHPIMKSVSLNNTGILETSKVIPGKDMDVLIKNRDTALLSVYNTKGIQAVCFSFDLLQSDLVLKPSFPILMRNCVMWLTGENNGNPGSIIRTGQLYEIFLSPWIENVMVATPEGISTEYTGIEKPFLYPHTQKAGIYRIQAENYTDQFAVNLINKEESDVNERDHTFTQGSPKVNGILTGIIDFLAIWHYFIIFCVVLLTCEWFIWLKTS